MKQLFVFDRPCPLFFSELATAKQVCDWLQANPTALALNEPHSCGFNVETSLNDEVITINGDADFCVCTLRELNPIF